MSDIHQHTFDSGLTLVVEPIAGMQSAGVQFMLPAGAAYQPADQLGVASVLSEGLFRGAGDRDAREHSQALDQLGVKRDTSVDANHLRLSATLLGERFDETLPLLTDMITAPRLADVSFEPARSLAIQAIDALDDDPQHKAMIELRRAHLPDPLGRSHLGRKDALQALTNQQLREFWQATFVPRGAIVGVAGRVSFEQVRDRLGALLGDWAGQGRSYEIGQATAGRYEHVHSNSTQQHIGIAYRAPAEADEQSALQRVAVAVLSGGMSGRLFTEVRERRGLCYAVFAAYTSLRDRGAIMAYAGTTNERAQQTLDVLTGELARLSDGVDADEFERATVGLKSRVVMQGESSAARAAAISTDTYLLGRPRTLDELSARIDAVTLDQLNAFVAAHRPENLTTLTIGPDPLTPPSV